MREGFRFDPPRFELDAETAWLFSRAFGPVESGFDGAVDGGRAVDLAAKFSLTPRIGARIPSDKLGAEVGVDAAQKVYAAFQQSAARSIAHEGLCRKVAEVAKGLGLPTVFLKGAAQYFAGVTAPGFRDSCDVDVLLDADAARMFQTALLDGEFHRSGFRASSHQLAAIVHSSGLMIEIHVKVPGVSVGGSARGAEFGSLGAAGLLRQVAVLPSESFIPTPEVMVAHNLAHGISQHGLAPWDYPMARMLADHQDLVDHDDTPDGALSRAHNMVESRVSGQEISAVDDLLCRMGNGASPEQIAREESGAGKMLRHVVAGSVDNRYQQSLKIAYFRDMGKDQGLLKTVGHSAVRALWPTRTQLDVIFGRPKNSAGYFLLRIWRPFDLVIRAGRYGAAAVRHRLRR